MTSIETEHFDGKCDAYIEGYCYDTNKGKDKVKEILIDFDCENLVTE